MTHSKPRLMSVGWSTTNSPGLTLRTTACAGARSPKTGAANTVIATSKLTCFTWTSNSSIGVARQTNHLGSIDANPEAGAAQVGLDSNWRHFDSAIRLLDCSDWPPDIRPAMS